MLQLSCHRIVKAALVLAVCAMAACGGNTGPEPGASAAGRAVALTHARLIDGNGTPEKTDQTVLIKDGQIRAVTASVSAHIPRDAEVLDLSGRTVMPGLVGMHEHLFYQMEPPGAWTKVVAAQRAFAKLYLAAGVTTIRTAGTIDLDDDLWIKSRIDNGKEPGPKIHVTSPYLDGTTAKPDPARTAREVERAADAGATSFKAYTALRSSELKAAIEAAHNRGLRITGHLCAVGFREAAALGIDNVEHGLLADTELYSEKKADECPNQSLFLAELTQVDVSDQVKQMIWDLVRHGVALTSTLAAIESYTGSEAAFDPRVEPVLSFRLKSSYEAAANIKKDPNSPQARMWAGLLRKEMDFERAFVAAGGKLMAGADPTGWGGVVAGFADQRELELLMATGLAPEEAIKVATSNGASFLREPHIGRVAPGMQADLVVVRGDPARHSADIRNVERVFKDGAPYDPASLIAEAEGGVGALEVRQLVRWPNIAILCVVLALVLLRRRRRRDRQARQASHVKMNTAFSRTS